MHRLESLSRYHETEIFISNSYLCAILLRIKKSQRHGEVTMSTSMYRVLFPEDEPTIREVLTEYMLISGYEVTEAEWNCPALKTVQFQETILEI